MARKWFLFFRIYEVVLRKKFPLALAHFFSKSVKNAWGNRKGGNRWLVQIMAIAFLGLILSLGFHFFSPVKAESPGASLIKDGTQLLQIGRVKEALETWKEAEEWYDSQGDEIGVTGSRLNQAIALDELGLVQQSCDLVLNAFGNDKTCEELTNSDLFLLLGMFDTEDDYLNFNGWQILGKQLRAVGNLDLSRYLLETGVDLERSPDEKSQALLNLGNTERSLAKQAKNFQELKNFNNLVLSALNSYEKAADIQTSSALTRVRALLNHLSFLIEYGRWLGDKENQGLQPIQSFNFHLEFASNGLLTILYEIASLPDNTDKIKAQINLAENLMHWQKISDNSVSKNPVLVDLESASRELAGLRQIEDILNSAIKLARELGTGGNPRWESYALGQLGLLHLEDGNLPIAKKRINEALIIAQRIGASDIAYQWQWQLGRIFKQDEKPEKALFAYKAAFNTLQVLRRDLAALSRDIQFDFRDKVEPIYQELVELLLPAGIKDPSSDNLRDARQVIEALQLAELDNFFHEACLDAKPEQVDTIISKYGDKAAFIYAIVLGKKEEERLNVIASLPGDRKDENKLSFYSTVIDKNNFDLDKNIKRFILSLKELHNYQEGYNSSFSKLYECLIPSKLYEKLENLKNLTTLVFVLDGKLKNIPIATLYDSNRGGFLIQKYAVVLAPGLELIEPESLRTKRKLTALTGGLAGIEEEAPSFKNLGWPPLEHVQSELKEITKILKTKPPLIERDFTRKKLNQQLESSSFSIVHLATHGQFSSNIKNTFILDWDDRLTVTQLRDLLQSSQINASEAIEMLVLSACQTATGDERASLGLAGVAMRSGARSTLATLWNVDDKSTAEFMVRFYKELIEEKLSKAEALRKTQEAFLKGDMGEREKHPYFWGAFVLVGNWL